MRIKIFGYRGKFNGTELIEKEMLKMGHSLVGDDDCDLLLHLTGAFSDAEAYYKNCKTRAIRLYCLLDIDVDKPREWYNQVIQDLYKCEIPCVISQTVANQLKNLFNFTRPLNILHYPVRNIKYLNWVKGFSFLYTGRLYSKNKKFSLAVDTLRLMNVSLDTFVVAGTEYPGHEFYWVDSPEDEVMNALYNGAKFLLSPSSFEGQNCNILSAAICHCYPIVNVESEVVKEFGLEKFATEPNPYAMAAKINEIETNPKPYDAILNELRPEFEQRFSPKTIAENIISLYNQYKNKAICQNH